VEKNWNNPKRTLDMGWTELERKLIQTDNNWFVDQDDPKYWDELFKVLAEELPGYQRSEIMKIIDQAKSALLPPISKTRMVRWLQHNMPQESSGDFSLRKKKIS
jgi:hypothetical protein